MQSSDEPTGRRRASSSLPMAVLLAVLVGLFGAFGVIRAANERSSEVDRIDGLDDVLAVDTDGPAVNYLLIGSDSREGSDPDSADFANIGDTGDVQGRRSDTIMILRQERDGNGASLVSIPRDLWVEIAGRGSSSRINSAYNDGADVLAATISQELGIPIHHVIDIDFFGFKQLVDAIGGTTVCFEYETRDTNSGLHQNAGCNVLDGEQALAYARSRYYEEWKDGSWEQDPRADLGRIERQQQFIKSTVDTTLQKVAADPFLTSELLDAAVDTVRLDPALDPIQAAATLRKAFGSGLNTYQLPVEGTTISGNAVLLLDDGAEPILAYFRGDAPAPPTTVAEG